MGCGATRRPRHGRGAATREPRSRRGATAPQTPGRRSPTPPSAGFEGARAGLVLNRSGDVYKPQAVRNYERCLRLRVLPDLGDRRLGDLRRADLQRLVDDRVAAGDAPATIKTTINAVRVINRHAIGRDQVDVNPAHGLQLPAVRSKRRAVASPEQAERLLAVLDPAPRALWATAIYAGLRRGELTGLRWDDVDLAGGIIRVERGWDRVEGEVAPKSRQGRRKVPVIGPLRDILVELRMGADGDTRVFRSASWVERVAEGARATWRVAGLEPVITLHDGRHTFASLMIAAGVNAKALSTYMGHATIAITYELYGHLLPGQEAEAAQLLEAFIAAHTAGTHALTVPRTVPQDAVTP